MGVTLIRMHGGSLLICYVLHAPNGKWSTYCDAKNGFAYSYNLLKVEYDIVNLIKHDRHVKLVKDKR